VLRRIDLPEFLEPDAEFRRLAIVRKPVFRDQDLAERSARAFGEQCVLAEQLHAAGEAVGRLALLADAHVAGGDAAHLAIVTGDQFGRREARIDFNAQRLGLRGQEFRDQPERADEAAMVAHQRRCHEQRHLECTGLRHPGEAVVRNFGFQRTVGVFAPIGQQAVQPGGVDHGAREDVGADLGALFHHHDADIRRNLFQPDRSGEPGRAGANDDDVKFHTFAGRQLGH
jgi:hypothetical protein